MKKILIVLGVIFVFSAMVTPIYYVFTKVTAGSDHQLALVPKKSLKKHTVMVKFLASNASNIPVSFQPLVKKLAVVPGKSVEIFYHARNDSGKTLPVMFVPEIRPAEAAQFVIKSDCYSLPKQTLYKGELVDLPLSFHINPKMPHFIKEIVIKYVLKKDDKKHG